jgi:S-adenosylmethionine:diacylglycerol 3-amino-3-carboxypropyl transferase
MNGRGRPKNAISQRTAPNEKNQNSSPAQSRCVAVARAKAVKNVWLKIAQIGNRKIAQTNFTQRVGTVSGSGAEMNRVARATLRTIFRSRCGFRLPRRFVDLRFVAAKVIRRLRRRCGERKSNPFTRTIARWNRGLRG